MAGSKYFTKLDLKDAFLQIPLHEGCRDLFSFEVPSYQGRPAEKFRFKTMPFGLNSASEIFQRVMERILHEEISAQTVTVFIDDIIVHTSGNLSQHFSDVERVFEKILQSGMKVKPSKLEIAQTEIPFCGHIIRRDGLKINPERTAGIENYPAPKDSKGLKRFLGMTSYVRRHIKDYANITQPLTDLTKKDIPFEWDPKCEQAFTNLKGALMSAPVLALPNFSKPFRLYADASGVAVGATLMQDDDQGNERPIAYASKTLSDRERRWQTTEREAYALFWSTTHFEQYLKGVKFTLVTDHKPITWLKTCKDPTPKVYRWILWLNDFDFEVEYAPGETQVFADALSRMGMVNVIRFVEALAWEPDDLAKEQQEDPDLGVLLQAKIQGLPIPSSIQGGKRHNALRFLWHRIKIDEKGVAYLRNKSNTQDLLIVPRSKRAEIFHLFHSLPSAGHLCATKTLANIQSRFYWPGLGVDVIEWCSSCLDCARTKIRTGRKHVPLHPITPPDQPFQVISMDINKMPVITARGNNCILVITDLLTKWVEVYALPDETAETVSNCVVDFISRHGCPERIITDQGPNFESNLFKKLCQDFNILKNHTTEYHPAANGD